MKRRTHSIRPRWITWATATACFVLFLFSTVVAFPNQTWNRVPGLPPLSLADFRLGLDLQGGAHLVYEADMSQIAEADRDEALNGVKDVIERRVNAFGVAEPLVQTTVVDGHYRVIIELAGVLDISEAIKQIGETPILEFKEQNLEYTGDLTEEQQAQIDAANALEKTKADGLLADARSVTDFLQFATDTAAADPETLGGDLPSVSGGVYQAVIDDITKNRYAAGTVLPNVYALTNSYSIFKYVEPSTDTNEMQLSHILVCFQGATGCASDRDQIGASLIISEILSKVNGENFADLAMQYSEDGAAEAGGDLGWIQPGGTVPAFDAAAQALAVGAISTSAVETEYGYHLIYKRGERPITTYHLQHLSVRKTLAGDLFPFEQWQNTGLSGKQLETARVEFDPNTGAPLVSLNFDSEGGELFAELTGAHIGEQIAIFLDGEVISAPMVQQRISGGQAVITGDFTLAEAKLLAQRLNAGALPVPVTLVSQQTVGPTLGQESLAKSIDAALIGFGLVALFMILYYRLPGAVAVLTLAGYAVLNLLAYKGLDVTITLAGVAGFILSMGMAVDANVLIFERLKEEVRSGRDVPSALEEAFVRAWPSIRDGNLTTLIASFILFWFSTSFIKGFALTLSIGVLLSMFSAVVITRVVLRLASFTGARRFPWLFGK